MTAVAAAPAAGYSETALKARYCAQLMAAACVLAATAPDDFHRRVLARPVLVYCHEFIRWARRAKNELRARPELRAIVGRLERALDDLERRDWGDYEQIRHRIAAHRQTIDPDVETSLTSGNAMWFDLADDALRILTEDARAIWNDLATAQGIPTLDSYPPISAELQAAIDRDGYESPPPGLRAGVGSFDATRPDSAPAIQGGDIGEHNRQIVDAIRNIRTLSQLWLAVNGHEPFWRIVLGATATEACTLVDLLFGPTAGDHQQPSLLALLEQDARPSPAIAALRGARTSLDPAALAHVRELRNRGGAHIDDRLAVHEISALMQNFDPDKLNAVIDSCFEAVQAAANVDVSLRPILLFDAVMAGLSLRERPATPPYGTS